MDFLARFTTTLFDRGGATLLAIIPVGIMSGSMMVLFVYLLIGIGVDMVRGRLQLMPPVETVTLHKNQPGAGRKRYRLPTYMIWGSSLPIVLIIAVSVWYHVGEPHLFLFATVSTGFVDLASASALYIAADAAKLREMGRTDAAAYVATTYGIMLFGYLTVTLFSLTYRQRYFARWYMSRSNYQGDLRSIRQVCRHIIMAFGGLVMIYVLTAAPIEVGFVPFGR